MSATSSRLIFVFLLVVNCILWSQSRYGYVNVPVYRGEQSLAKRIFYELTNPDALLAEKQCRPLSVPTELQCSHVEERCPAAQTFLSFHYLKGYFCTEVTLRPVVFVGLLVWLIFLFSTLGISASDFFTPNLATIAQMLRLDENVAGVTFLAFGNGSPDVFSTFSAMRADSGSLAIGELLGAASFIVSCVVGSMCIIKPFQVNRGPFLRDVGFFTVAVSLLLFILWDGSIRPWEAGVMVCLYLVYVLTVVIGTWWDKRRQKLRTTEAMARAEYRDDDMSHFDFPYRDDPSPSSSQTFSEIVIPSPTRARAISAPAPLPRLQTEVLRRHSRTPSPPPFMRASSPMPTQMPSFSLVGALEFREVVASLRNQSATASLSMFDSPVTPFAGGHYHRSRRPSRATSREIGPWDEALGGLRLNSRSAPHVLVTSAQTEEPESLENSIYPDDDPLSQSRSSTIPSIMRTPASPTLSEAESEARNYLHMTLRQRIVYALKGIYHTLFPSLHRFRNQSVLGQIASVFAAPAVMLLTLTLPVVVTPYNHNLSPAEKTLGNDHNLIDFEEEGVERVLVAEEEVQEEMHGITFSKWLCAAQCIFGPLFCVGVLFSTSHHRLWLLFGAAVVGIAMAILVAVVADRGDNPTFRMARCSMGFFVACVWIMAIADEVVNVLQTFGFIFGLSDAIIGLTIFAVGNSLADLVANMSVAVFAPIMGFSACFGGPMLNILLGVGISGSYIISKTGQPYSLHFGTTLLVSGIGLLALLAVTLIVVPLKGYFLTRWWGIFLIASYTTIMTINVVVELRS